MRAKLVLALSACLAACVLAAPARASSVDRGHIQQVVRQRLVSVRRCYERVLAVSPSAEGRVVVRFTVAPSGAVGDVIVERSDITDAAFGPCLVAALRPMQFRPFAGAGKITVRYPFDFRPSP